MAGIALCPTRCRSSPGLSSTEPVFQGPNSCDAILLDRYGTSAPAIASPLARTLLAGVRTGAAAIVRLPALSRTHHRLAVHPGDEASTVVRGPRSRRKRIVRSARWRCSAATGRPLSLAPCKQRLNDRPNCWHRLGDGRFVATGSCRRRGGKPDGDAGKRAIWALQPVEPAPVAPGGPSLGFTSLGRNSAAFERTAKRCPATWLRGRRRPGLGEHGQSGQEPSRAAAKRQSHCDHYFWRFHANQHQDRHYAVGRGEHVRDRQPVSGHR